MAKTDPLLKFDEALAGVHEAINSLEALGDALVSATSAWDTLSDYLDGLEDIRDILELPAEIEEEIVRAQEDFYGEWQ